MVVRDRKTVLQGKFHTGSMLYSSLMTLQSLSSGREFLVRGFLF